MHVKQLCNCKTQPQKDEIIKAVAKTSTHTWRHINLHGEFDFAEQNITPTFDMEAILKLDIRPQVQKIYFYASHFNG